MTIANVIDSIMGSGKTNHILKKVLGDHSRDKFEFECRTGENYLTREYRKKYLIVVPLRSEIVRFKKALQSMFFHDPQPVHGHKLYHLDRLIKDGLNVICTHALFGFLTIEICEELKGQKYILIIDETLDCVEEYDGLDKHERKLLLDQDWIWKDANNRCVWNKEKLFDYRGKHFTEVRALCETGSLVLMNETMLLWEFPVEFIKCFDEIWLCTYIFMGSPFFSYLLSYDFDMNLFTIKDHKCVPMQGSGSDETALKERLRALITLHETGAAANLTPPVGRASRENPYSMAWFRRQGNDVFSTVRNGTRNFFTEIAKTPANLNGWTTWKEFKSRCEGPGYTKTRNPYQQPDDGKKKAPIPTDEDGNVIEGLAYGFIHSNAKGSNNWMNVASMAYLCNTFYHTVIRQYFVERSIPVYDELYALSEMIQWVWRSRIRNNEPINLYIPSERMRDLFKKWLNSNSLEELLTEKLYPPGHPHHARLKLLFVPDDALKEAA